MEKYLARWARAIALANAWGLCQHVGEPSKYFDVHKRRRFIVSSREGVTVTIQPGGVWENDSEVEQHKNLYKMVKQSRLDDKAKNTHQVQLGVNVSNQAMDKPDDYEILNDNVNVQKMNGGTISFANVPRLPTGDAGTAAVANAFDVGVDRYIADTGASNHLLALESIKDPKIRATIKKLLHPQLFSTAGGIIECTQAIKLLFPQLGQKAIVAHLLDSTPAVVSVGRFCIQHGYAFHWPMGSKYPYFESPSGEIIYLQVQDFAPYLVPTEAYKQLCPSTQQLENLQRWCHVDMKAQNFLSDFQRHDGPRPEQVRRRVTLDLHSRTVMEDLGHYQTASEPMRSGSFPDTPTDILTYVYYLDDIATATPGPQVPEGAGQAGADHNDDSNNPYNPGDITEVYARDFNDSENDPHSLWHMLTHLPKLDNCKICQQAKMQRRRHSKKVLQLPGE